SVYWTNAGTSGRNYTDGTIMKAPISGGTPSALVTGQNNPQYVVVDTNYVYWTNEGAMTGGNGTVMKAPARGGASVALAVGQNRPLGISIDATHVYWTDYFTPGTVMKISKN
ncbi:MAG: hypothetical protein M3O46_02620, partial [Myxococcota bacterium]|nr:hypothetical protein [Myxococcota bacterium]